MAEGAAVSQELISVRDAAKMLGCCAATIRKMVRVGELAHLERKGVMGERIKIPKADVDRFISSKVRYGTGDAVTAPPALDDDYFLKRSITELDIQGKAGRRAFNVLWAAGYRTVGEVKSLALAGGVPGGGIGKAGWEAVSHALANYLEGGSK